MRRRPKKVQDLMDQDYAHKLSKEEREWLNKFNQVYYIDNVNYDKNKEYLDTPASEAQDEIGDTPTNVEHRRWLGRRNSKRIRDVWTQFTHWVFTEKQCSVTDRSPEDAIIELLDSDNLEYLYETYLKLNKLELVEEDENE